MGLETNSSVNVYIGLHSWPSTHRQFTSSKDSVIKTITSDEENKNEDNNDELDEEIERVIRCNNSPYIILPNCVQMHGSGLRLLLHSGCVDSDTTASKLKEDAWDELWRSGSFWLLCCAAPNNNLHEEEKDEREKKEEKEVGGSNPNLFNSLRGSEESMLQYLVMRLFDIVSHLSVSVIRWTEGGEESSTNTVHSPFWRNSYQKNDEFTDMDSLLRFIREYLTENRKESLTFSFSLVSITFSTSTSEKKYEIVITSVNARYDILSVNTSNSLIAVRTLFTNIAHISMNDSYEKEENKYSILKQLNLYLTDLLPEEVLHFILIHCNVWNKEDKLNYLGANPPRVVYAILETHDGVIVREGVDKNANYYESTCIEIVRHLSFWCSLGTSKVYENTNKNVSNHNEDYQNTVKDSKYSSHNTLNQIKYNLLTLLIDTEHFPQLIKDWERSNNNNNKGGDVMISKSIFLETLERVHRKEEQTRQNGLQDRVRRILSSRPRNSNLSRRQFSAVNMTLKLFGVENEALLWCQKLEEKYYTLLHRVFYKDWEIQCDTLSTQGRNSYQEQEQRQQQQEEEEEEENKSCSTFKENELTQIIKRSQQQQHNDVHLPIVILSVKNRESSSSFSPYSFKLTSSSLFPSLGCELMLTPGHNSFRRLSEVENIKRLLIMINAADSLQLLLFSSLHHMRCYNNQLMTSLNEYVSTQHDIDNLTSQENKFPTLSQENQLFQEFIQQRLSNYTDFPLVLEYIYEKIHWFTKSIFHLQQQNKETVFQNSSLKKIDAVTQTSIASLELPIQEKDGDMDCCGPEESLTVKSETSRHRALEEVSSTTTSAYTSEYEENTPFQQQEEKYIVKDNLVSYPDVQEKGVVEKERMHTLVLGEKNAEKLRVLAEYNDYKEFLKGLTFIGRSHRLRRDDINTEGKQQRGYRLLLSTGRSVEAEKYHYKSGDSLPALSFSDITEERKHWSKPEVLDDYRKLLAYNIYLVGEVGCGKSTLVHSLVVNNSSCTSPPIVTPHTMTMERTSFIVKIPIQKELLPLGGYRNITLSNIQKWISLDSKKNMNPCSVGVNIIETPTPLLIAASTGNVKLPIRGTVYYIVYHLQDNWETIQCTIRKYMLALQSAVIQSSPHIINILQSSNSDVKDMNFGQESLPLPVVLIGTHADIAFDNVSMAQERLFQLRQWFEEECIKLREKTGKDKPHLFLVDSYFTSTLNGTVISEHPGVSTTFESLLWRTLWFLHYTAPLNPMHIVARWLPQMFFKELGVQNEINGVNQESDDPQTLWSNIYRTNGTLEEFWETIQSQHGKQDQDNRNMLIIPPEMSSVWWKRGSEGLLVLFTALQRLRQFISCSFDEQSLDDAVLYHLGFVLPDDPDETTVDEQDENEEEEEELYLRLRDIFLESIFEECRLRGVLLFLPHTSTSLTPHVKEDSHDNTNTTTITRTTPTQRMVIVGPEWVENLWSQTLAPALVVHHTSSLLQSSTERVKDVLMIVLKESLNQLGVKMPAMYFACVWPQLEESIREDVMETAADANYNIHKMQEYFSLYFNKSLVSLELLQLFWQPPHGVLTTKRETAAMGLIASGLTYESEVFEKEKLSGNNEELFFKVPCINLKNENTS
ncbi:uncharacterized protein TM35_000034320 [Trypanosoma theileri]|uniref:Uncharacterized protein n=1 Tax=Trypanosoma theileri TaxID=67003 RepID=A0A1X0P7X9_9TRYP|nr:uncharacterized protein TM35_000034320 [Trypanosoma theileri]ORC92679.1 hypothetical protein TM35_000034320 [Trypanosoma theileri]